MRSACTWPSCVPLLLAAALAPGCRPRAPAAPRRAPAHASVDVVARAATGGGTGSDPSASVEPLEAALRSLRECVHVHSAARASRVVVRCELAPGVDPFGARSRVARALAQAELPAGVYPELSSACAPDVPLLRYTVNAADARQASVYERRVVRARLLTVPGVAAAATCGAEDPVFDVEVDPARLASAGVTFEEVESALSRRPDQPPTLGRLETGSRAYVVRGVGAGYASIAELQGRPVAYRDGAQVTVSTVAAVSERARTPGCIAARGAASSVVEGRLCFLARADAEGALQRARATLAAVAREAPPGVSLSVFEPGSEVIELRAALPAGASSPERRRTLAQLLDAARSVPGVADALGEVDDDGELAPWDAPDEAHLLIALGPLGASARAGDGPRVMVPARLSAAVPGVAPPAMDAPAGVLWIAGPDAAVRAELAEGAAAALRGARGVSAVRVLGAATVSALQITLQREQLARYGLRSEDVSRQLLALRTGLDVLTSDDSDGARPVRLLLGTERGDEAVRSATLDGPGGARIPLSQLATLSVALEPALVLRRDGRPIVEVRVYGERGRTATARWAAQHAVARLPLPPGYERAW